MFAATIPSPYVLAGLGCALGCGLIVLRAALLSNTRSRALERGCICPIALRRSRFNTREGLQYYKPACPVHGGAVERPARFSAPVAFALGAAVLALALLALGLR